MRYSRYYGNTFTGQNTRKRERQVRAREVGAVTLKGLASPGGSILLRPNERCVAEDRRDCYWLNVMTNCTSTPELRSRSRIPPGFRATK